MRDAFYLASRRAGRQPHKLQAAFLKYSITFLISMQIRRFYVPELNSAERVVSLPEGESQHALRVLRLQPGDELLLLNGRGLTARAELLPPPEGVRRPRQALCNVIDVQLFPQSEPALELCVAPPRGKAF